jgi:ribose 5-phosphate isomerase
LLDANKQPDSNKQQALEEALLAVPGVLEVTLHAENGAAYLKVNRDFDAVKARAVLAVLGLYRCCEEM